MAEAKTIHHNGAAETLGVTPEELENMSLREIAERCFDLGLEPVFKESGGVGPGLTLSGEKTEVVEETG